MVLADKISLFGIFLAIVGIAVGWCQLEQANDALTAANTIQINRDARDVAERIIAANAKDDDEAMHQAYDYYLDFIAYAGYLKDRGQIDQDLWGVIYQDFCEMRKTKTSFRLWYTQNRDAIHYGKLFPAFSELHEHCPP